MRYLLVGMFVIMVGACSGPVMWLPGGQLEGPEMPLVVASVAADVEVLQLETNPIKPYSVNLGFQRIDGQIYIDPAADRQWYKYIQADPMVRVRFGDAKEVNLAVAAVVTNADILAQFEADRVVLRIDPRP